MRRKTHKEYINELKLVDSNIDVLGEYINNTTKKLSTKILNKQTMERFKLLEMLGYKIICVWEQDYRNRINISGNVGE